MSPSFAKAAEGGRRVRSGQAMIETVLAVLFITFTFMCLFKLSYFLTGKVLLEHAAMRVARARTVGFNNFMCLKAARVAVIPVAGECLWPTGEDALTWGNELARVRTYMESQTGPEARGILEYERWDSLGMSPGDGTSARTSMSFDLFDEAIDVELGGRAGLENNYSLYMNDEGR